MYSTYQNSYKIILCLDNAMGVDYLPIYTADSSVKSAAAFLGSGNRFLRDTKFHARWAIAPARDCLRTGCTRGCVSSVMAAGYSVTIFGAPALPDRPKSFEALGAATGAACDGYCDMAPGVTSGYGDADANIFNLYPSTPPLARTVMVAAAAPTFFKAPNIFSFVSLYFYLLNRKEQIK